MGLSDTLKRRREQLGLTLKDIAERLGVSEATVQRYESGNIKQLRHGKIAKLAEILDVSPAELMGYDVLQQEKPAPNKESGLTLDEKAMELLQLFRAATPEMKAAAIAMLEAADKARTDRDSSNKD